MQSHSTCISFYLICFIGSNGVIIALISTVYAFIIDVSVKVPRLSKAGLLILPIGWWRLVGLTQCCCAILYLLNLALNICVYMQERKTNN